MSDISFMYYISPSSHLWSWTGYLHS